MKCHRDYIPLTLHRMHITTMITNDATHPPMMPKTCRPIFGAPTVVLSPTAYVVPATSKSPSIILNGKSTATARRHRQ